MMKIFAQWSTFFSLIYLWRTSSAMFVEGEMMPNREYSEPSTNIRQTAEQLYNDFKSIFSNEENCIMHKKKCNAKEGEESEEHKPCCENLSCLLDIQEKEFLCLCGDGYEFDDGGSCSWLEYPNFVAVLVWILVAAGATISCSYIVMMLTKRKSNSSRSSTNYSTFEAPSEVHITSMFSPAATSQMVDIGPPVYHMDDLPPSYSDAVETKCNKNFAI